MDDFLIKQWNSVVGIKDEVIILGDFAFDRQGNKINSLMKKLKAKKIFFKGNRDFCRISVEDVLDIVKGKEK